MEKVLPQKLYTRDFILLCLSHALFAGSFTMIIPELPAYLTSLGGEEYKGLIISLFTLTAGLSRPFSGKLADTIGRMPVMIFGVLACVVCSFLYPFFNTVFGFLALRFIHGLSTGFKPTASTAYVADVVPSDRRGEALGMMGVSMNVGASIAPAFGSSIVLASSVNWMFYTSSFVALLSILILMGIKESLPNKVPFKASLLKIKKDEILDQSAIAPGIIVLMIYFCFGAFLTVVPDQSDFLGLSNKGFVFTSFTIFTILSRLVAGKISDIYGRVIVIKVSIILTTISLVLFGMATTPFTLLAGAGFLGFTLGISVPAIFAWAIDRSQENSRGKAMATVYIAVEIAIGSGALVSAFLYDNNPDNFFLVFLVCGIIAFGGWVYTQLRGTKD